MNAHDSKQHRWIELSVAVDCEAVESVVDLFSRYGFSEGVVIEEPFVQDRDGDNVAVDPGRLFVVRTYIPAESFDPATQTQIEHGLWHLGRLRTVGALLVETRVEEDWANAWKEHYVPVRASERVVIRPPWCEYEPTSGDIVVTLDPGMAFGTGTHPTTQISLRLIEQRIFPDASVLDVGTGSGILAIAAAQMGASRVDAFDIDPVAVRQAIENVESNAVGGIVRVAQSGMPPETASRSTYDLVVANIIARILVELSEVLVRATKAEGVLILSGLIDAKEAAVVERFHELGMTLVQREQVEDWIGHIWERTG